MGRDTLDLTKAQIAWAAGLMDGEAYFATYDDSTRAEIEVTLTSPRALYLLMEMFGGSVNDRKKQQEHHKDAWRWRVCGDKARHAALLVLSYLQVKGPEAEAVANSALYLPGTEAGNWMRAAARLNREQTYAEANGD